MLLFAAYGVGRDRREFPGRLHLVGDVGVWVLAPFLVPQRAFEER